MRPTVPARAFESRSRARPLKTGAAGSCQTLQVPWSGGHLYELAVVPGAGQHPEIAATDGRGTRLVGQPAGQVGETEGPDGVGRPRGQCLGPGLGGGGVDQRDGAGRPVPQYVGRRPIGETGGGRRPRQRTERNPIVGWPQDVVVVTEHVERARPPVDQRRPPAGRDRLHLPVVAGADLGIDALQLDRDLAGSQVDDRERPVVVEHQRAPEDARLLRSRRACPWPPPRRCHLRPRRSGARPRPRRWPRNRCPFGGPDWTARTCRGLAA